MTFFPSVCGFNIQPNGDSRSNLRVLNECPFSVVLALGQGEREGGSSGQGEEEKSPQNEGKRVQELKNGKGNGGADLKKKREELRLSTRGRRRSFISSSLIEGMIERNTSPT